MKRIIITLALLATLAAPQTVQAYPRNCRFIPHGQVCTNSITGNLTGRCDAGYQMLANWTCSPLPARPWAPLGVP